MPINRTCKHKILWIAGKDYQHFVPTKGKRGPKSKAPRGPAKRDFKNSQIVFVVQIRFPDRLSRVNLVATKFTVRPNWCQGPGSPSPQALSRGERVAEGRVRGQLPTEPHSLGGLRLLATTKPQANPRSIAKKAMTRFVATVGLKSASRLFGDIAKTNWQS